LSKHQLSKNLSKLGRLAPPSGYGILSTAPLIVADGRLASNHATSFSSGAFPVSLPGGRPRLALFEQAEAWFFEGEADAYAEAGEDGLAGGQAGEQGSDS
jgi:hypothetical protein